MRPPFVWSFSRHRTWERCRRAYWYDYYGSRGGWRSRAEPRTRELYLLKGLKSVPQWVGVLVHHVAERALGVARDGRPSKAEHLVDDAVRRAKREIADAKRGMYRLNPKGFVGFVDLEYGEADEEAWSHALVDVESQVRALLEHPIMRRLLAVPHRIAEVEQLERVPVGEVPVWVSLDVLVEDGRGGLVVVDWKTGRHVRPEQVQTQVTIYASYVQRRYGTRGEAISGLVASTRTGDFLEFPFDASRAAEVAAFVRASAQEMMAVLPDPTEDAAPEEAFPRLPEGSPECARCRYRRVCGRE